MTTQTESLILPPSADLTGPWEGNEPLLVNASGFKRFRVLAALADAYKTGDGAAGFEGGTFLLPDVGADTTLETITVVATSVYDTGAKIQNHPLPYPNDPAKKILPGDFILIGAISWTVTITGAPATPSGYTLRNSWKDAGEQHSPRLTLWWKIANGDESGDVDIDVTAVSPDGGQLSSVMVIYRGVDESNPWAASTSGPVHANAANPDGPSITPAVANSRVLSIVGMRRWGGDPNAQAPQGYGIDVEQFLNGSRGVSIAAKEAAATATDPGAWTYNTEAYTIVTEALRPAQTFGDKIAHVLGVAAVDSSGGGTGGISAFLEGINEVQTLTSTLGSGTTTLTFDGQTTAAIDFDADAATIQTELEALSNIASGDVEVSGGPLDTLPVHIEFVGNLGSADQPLMSASSGLVNAAQTIAGKTQVSFDFALATAEQPRSGGSNSPQVSLFVKIRAYESGRTVRFNVDTSGTVKTWAAFLLIGSNLFETFPVQDAAEITIGTGQEADLGSITPTIAGSRILTIVSKALASGNYPVAAAGVSRPADRTIAASAVGDSCSIDAIISPPVPSGTAIALGKTQWPIIEKFSGINMTLRPASNPLASNSYEVLGPGVDEWMEMAHTTTNFYHVVEFGLDTIPANAILVAGTINFVHQADDEHGLQVVLVGIYADGTIEPCEGQGRGFAALPLGTAVAAETVRWTRTAAGSPINDFNRLGVAFISNTAAPALTEHRVYNAELNLEFISGGPVISNVVGPSNAGDPLATWNYESSGGLAQIYYEVMVIRGSNQDPLLAVDDDPWQGTTGNKVYESGLLTGPDVRSFSLTDYPLYNGENTVGVRSWTRVNGDLVASDWATANFNITGTPPSAPTFSSGPALNETNGKVEMTVNTPAGVSRAFLARSFDGGTIWELVPNGGPFEVIASSTATLSDPTPLSGEATLYRVIVDDGPTSESNWANWSGDYTPVLKQWYLTDPTPDGSAVVVEVADVSVTDNRRAVIARQEGRGVVGSSAPLGATIEVTARVRSAAERRALVGLVDSEKVLRLADPLGRAWYCRASSSAEFEMMRVQPEPGVDLANIRDMHEVSFTLNEVAFP